MSERIPSRWRAALGAKGALLGAMALGFAALALIGAFKDQHWALRVVALVVFGYLAYFLGWAASLALADALLGEAVRDSGAEALASRRAGWSLQLPDGHFAEYILWNPWEPLVPGKRYTVIYGRRSRVLVAPPQLEG